MTETTTPTGGFVHLHVHTEYSGLDGMTKVADGVKKVAADGQPAFSVTDHGDVGAAWTLGVEAKKAGIKPLVGCEVYLAVMADWRDEPDRTQKQNVKVDRDDDSAVDDDVDERGGAQSSTQKLKKYEHLTLFATTPTGWKNLATILDIAEESGFHAKPRIDFALLKQYHEGIIVLTGCLGGPILGPISRHVNATARAQQSSGDEAALYQEKADDALAQAHRNMERIIDAVGAENVYVEIMEHGIESESVAIPAMAEFAAQYNLPLVATNDSHYTNDEDHETHEAWLAVQSGRALSDPKRFQFHGRGYFIRTEAEMRALRPEPWWQVACDNTVKVAARFDDDVLPVPELHLPQYPVPDGYRDQHQFLIHLIKEGAKKRYATEEYPDGMTPEVRERLNMETKIVKDQGFDDYFLIVWDLIKWSREDGNLPDWPQIDGGILVGPGRGSAAGAVMSYCLEIVDIDPLENNLLFERFMEPGRKDMPDIDIDFEKRYVDRVRAYLAHKWGHDKVARIGTHNVAQTKAAIKDAARVLELVDAGNKLTKEVPFGMGFKELDDINNGATAQYRDVLEKLGGAGDRIVTLAKKINGTLKGQGIHACGIIISDVPLRGLIPLRRDRSKAASGGLSMVTAWDAPDIVDMIGPTGDPAVGLLKLDVLSIRNLDIVSQAIDFIEETTGERLDPRNLPHPNTKGNPMVSKAYELISAGRTEGVFQMESSGMKNVARDVGPESLGDISAILALFRPGPLSAGMVDQFARRKQGVEPVTYNQFSDDPAEQEAIASVLGETYGVWVFQESLMRLGAVVAGFDAVLRSKLRKAVAKKKADVMAEVTKYFIDGAVKEFRDENGEVTSIKFSAETAEKLMIAMQGSASYLFNASHSAAYAQISYITAYLKANWPAEYGAAILATTKDKERRLAAIDALRNEGIVILPPDVNRSQRITSPEGGAVRIGLSEIDKVGILGDDVIDIRERDGIPFDSLSSFVYRMNDVAEKKTPSIAGIEGLIEAGACDEFGPRLGQLMVVRAVKSKVSISIPDAEFGVLERSMRQRARLGVSLGEHPLVLLKDQVKAWHLPGVETIENRWGKDTILNVGSPVIPIGSLPDTHGEERLVAGLLAQWGTRAYSKGQMANITLEGSRERISGTMWDDSLKTVVEVPAIGSVVAVYAGVNIREREIEDEEGNVIETVSTKELNIRRVYPITVDNQPTGSFMEQIFGVQHPGKLPAVPQLELLRVPTKKQLQAKPPSAGPRGSVVNHSRTADEPVSEPADEPTRIPEDLTPAVVEAPAPAPVDVPSAGTDDSPAEAATAPVVVVPGFGGFDYIEMDEPTADVEYSSDAPTDGFEYSFDAPAGGFDYIELDEFPDDHNPDDVYVSPAFTAEVEQVAPAAEEVDGSDDSVLANFFKDRGRTETVAEQVTVTADKQLRRGLFAGMSAGNTFLRMSNP